MNQTDHNTTLQQAEREVHLLDYAHVIMRRWKIVLLVFLLVFVTMAVITFLTKPIYEAASTLEVGGKKKDSLIGELAMGADDAVSTEIEKLRSRTLAEQVIRTLNLHWQPVNYSRGSQMLAREFAVEADLPGLRIEVTGPGTYRVTTLTGGVLCQSNSGEPCSFDKGRLLIDLYQAKTGDFLEFERVDIESLQVSFAANLSVAEVGKATNIVRVAYRSTDPAAARDVVNLLVEGYLAQNVSARTAEAGKVVEFISTQLDGVRGKLDFSEQELQEYKVQTGLVTLGPEGNTLLEKLVALEQQKNELTLKRQRIDLAVSELSQAIKQGQPFNPPTIESVPQIANAAARLAELEATRKGLLLEYTAIHPAVLEVQSQITRVQEAMLSTYRTVRQEFVLSERDLTKTLGDFEAQLKDIPAAELELAKRMRVNKVNAELYTFLMQKQQEARIAEASTISSAKIIDPALTPSKPIKPNKRKNLALGFILGLMLGVGLAFLLEYLDRSIKTVEDVKELLGLSIYGIIPRIPFADQDRELPSRQLVTSLPPKSPVIEAFRALRTNLNYATAKEKHQLIMVTSSLPNEGKSTVAGNLAVILSQTGSKVLLIGCDLRRPSLYEMFNQPSKPGLTELLVNQDQSAVRQLVTPRIDLLPAGSIPPNPAEILDSSRMKKLLEMTRERYDYVVLDAPPVLPVTDAQILAPLVDRVLIVIEPCRVPISAAQQMVENLRAVNANILGVILNDKSGRGFKYYGNYSYYGNKYYRGYYGDTDVKPDGVFVGGVKKVWEKLNS